MQQKYPDAQIVNVSQQSGESGVGLLETEIVLSHKPVNKNEIKTEVVSTNTNIPQLNDVYLRKDMTPTKSGVFLERSRRNVTVKKLNETRTIEGKLCQGYQVTHIPGGERAHSQEGTMWIDIATGAPVFSEFKTTVNPQHITGSITKTYYTYDATKNQFYIHRSENTADVSVMGIKATTITNSLYENYWEFKG